MAVSEQDWSSKPSSTPCKSFTKDVATVNEASKLISAVTFTNPKWNRT